MCSSDLVWLSSNFLRVGTVMKTLSTDGKNLWIGNDCGRIWYRRSSGGTPEMDLHLRMNMKNIVLWLPRKIWGKEINPIPNLSLENNKRSVTCPE